MKDKSNSKRFTYHSGHKYASTRSLNKARSKAHQNCNRHGGNWQIKDEPGKTIVVTMRVK